MKKKRWIPVFVAVLLMVLVVLLAVGVKLVEKYTPSKERVNLNEAYDVHGDETAIVLNNELLEGKAVKRDDQCFVPISIVNTHLNDRYYWDEEQMEIVYALPDKLIQVNSDSIGKSGEKLLWVDNNDVYLSVEFIEMYTDVRSYFYDSSGINRLYLYNVWDEITIGQLSKDAKLRQKGGIKSPIITDMQKGQQVKLLEELEGWDKVVSEDGFIGYVEKKKITGLTKDTPVSSFQAPVYTNISLEDEIRLVWHQVTVKDANKNMEKLMADSKGINVISPTWYSVTSNEGEFSSLADKNYVDRAHEMGMQVWALIDNFNENIDDYELLKATSTRQRLINNLVEELLAFGIDGINVDFETVSEKAAPAYIQFIRELSIACRKNQLVLSIDNYVPASYNLYYNRKEQGIVADYIIIMGYDEHWAGSEPGSTASLPFVDRGIRDTLEEVPKEKVINAVPFFTRIWTDGGSKAAGIYKVEDIIEEKQLQPVWLEDLGQYFVEYEDEGKTTSIWIEDTRSMKLKMDTVKKYDIAGIACWKLGLESKVIWDVISPDAK